jgi:hypothetical protein
MTQEIDGQNLDRYRNYTHILARIHAEVRGGSDARRPLAVSRKAQPQAANSSSIRRSLDKGHFGIEVVIVQDRVDRRYQSIGSLAFPEIHSYFRKPVR